MNTFFAMVEGVGVFSSIKAHGKHVAGGIGSAWWKWRMVARTSLARFFVAVLVLLLFRV
jgi:hypothetical protein